MKKNIPQMMSKYLNGRLCEEMNRVCMCVCVCELKLFFYFLSASPI